MNVLRVCTVADGSSSKKFARGKVLMDTLVFRHSAVPGAIKATFQEFNIPQPAAAKPKPRKCSAARKKLSKMLMW